MNHWAYALVLDSARTVVAGSEQSLVDAIRQGADLCIGTEFLLNEHVDVLSKSTECIREVGEFAVTYLIGGQWVAGIMSLRQPVSLPNRFGQRPSMSFFRYKQNGQQAIAWLLISHKLSDGTTFWSTPSSAWPASIS